MKALVHVDFPGRPDGEYAVRTIEAGEVIEGDLADVAVKADWAIEVDEDTPVGKTDAELPAAPVRAGKQKTSRRKADDRQE